MSASGQKTILIVEDASDILFTLEFFFQAESYEVLVAQNGQEALDILEEKGLPDVILLDMKMPIMDGWKFAEVFRERYGDGSPIIVMTAAADAGLRAKDICAVDWVTKPFDLDVLLNKVKLYENAKNS